MKRFVTHDFDDAVFGTFNTRFEAENCFLEYHPYFHIDVLDHFIAEKEVFFNKCPEGIYKGNLCYESWQLGKIQRDYCRAIGIAKRRMSKEKVLGAIINTFKIGYGIHR